MPDAAVRHGIGEAPTALSMAALRRQSRYFGRHERHSSPEESQREMAYSYSAENHRHRILQQPLLSQLLFFDRTMTRPIRRAMKRYFLLQMPPRRVPILWRGRARLV